MSYNYTQQQIGNYNPAGIEINLGYYALAECILTDHHSGETLYRWCRLRETPKNAPKENFTPAKRRKIVRIIADRKKLLKLLMFNGLAYKDMCDIIGASTYVFYRMMKEVPVDSIYLERIEEAFNLKKGELIKENTK